MTPLQPTQRPALRALHPAVWVLEGTGRHVRGDARELLRELLASYLGKAPDQVPLGFVQGKAPCVGAQWQGLRLSISMSYCNDMALVALCAGARIGVDVTEVTPVPDWARIARLYLGPESAARLAACHGDSRDRMFALAWTELEARCKCFGLGLQEWTSARQARLRERSIQVDTGALPGFRSGLTHAFAVAWYLAL